MIWIPHWLVYIAMDVVGLPDRVGWLVGLLWCVVYGSLATYDYYRKIELDEKVWPFLSNLPPVVVSTPVLAIATVVLLAGNFWTLATQVPKCNDRGVTDLVEQIVEENSTISSVLSLSLIRDNGVTGGTRNGKARLNSVFSQYNIKYTVSRDESDPIQTVVFVQFE